MADTNQVTFSTSDFVGIQCTAQNVANAAQVAFWMSSIGGTAEDYLGHHISRLVEEADRLAVQVAALRAAHPYFAVEEAA